MEVAIVLATLCGPILAVQAQKWLERATESRRRKQWIFETLMATRATRLNPEHVRALNQIELDFSGTTHFFFRRAPTAKQQAVLRTWRNYADILNEEYADDDHAGLKAWGQRAGDAFVVLLHEMARALRHPLDPSQIRRGIYYPKGFGQSERRQECIQDSLARVLDGTQALKMHVESVSEQSDETTAEHAELRKALIGAFDSDGVLRVVMEKSKTGPKSGPVPIGPIHRR